MKYGQFLLPSKDTYPIKLFKRVKNSAYDYEEVATNFRGKPVQKAEVKNYRIMQGVGGNDSSVYIQITNIPQNLAPQDKITFMGRTYSIESIGYFFDDNKLVNASLFDEEYIIAHCPKGVALQ